MPTKSTNSAATPARARPGIVVQYASRARGMPAAARLVRWARAAAPDAEQITIRFVTQREGRELNLAYRGKDYATNVLTFAYEIGRSGDIVLCPAVIAREARTQGKALDAHYAHLAIHGALHLRGYDHERPADAARMKRVEIAMLKRFGYANPYRA